jgi:hypothetical protein
MKMGVLRTAVLASILLVSACSNAAPPSETAAPAPSAQSPALTPQVAGTLNQVMRSILFPNSNIIFDAQSNDPAAPAAENSSQPFSGVYGGWEKVENAAIALNEASNLINMPGRTCQNGKPVPLDNETYQKGILALRAAAAYAYKEAQAKNMDAMLDVADQMTQACSTCHDVFRDKTVDGKQIGLEDRCVP